MVAYLITLEVRQRSNVLPAPVRDRLRRLSAALAGVPSHAVPAVPAADALAAVGIRSAAAAAQLFGKQASEPEFEAALGCALSHLRAARRAVRDGAAPAIILEQDASLDLSGAWTISPADLAARAPGGWTAIQVGRPRQAPARIARALTHARGLRLDLALLAQHSVPPLHRRNRTPASARHSGRITTLSPSFTEIYSLPFSRRPP
jgi:hypothetical protein